MSLASTRRTRRRLSGRSIHVLVVDDSAVVRQVMTAVLSTEPGITVDVAADPIIAIQKIQRKRPDVIVLDLELPRMDGITFLHKIMSEDPVPVVICSSLAEKGTELSLRALEEGAVSIVSKPKLGVKNFLHESAVILIDEVLGAAHAHLRRRRAAVPAFEPKRSADAVLPLGKQLGIRHTTAKVVVIGASTGGTEAIREILESMPPGGPGIVVVQHMPELFTAAFAHRLNQDCAMEVKEAASGDRVFEGRALIAPGNRHTLLRRSGAHYIVEVSDGPLVNRHRPSVDVLFRSAAQAAGPNALGVILTGMGDDGAEGLLEMKRAGSTTLAQDEASCVVFGMPKEAIERGAVDHIFPLSQVAEAIRRKVVSPSSPGEALCVTRSPKPADCEENDQAQWTRKQR